MKILVTGGLGFIGSETVVSLIRENYDVVIVDNLFNSKITVLDKIQKITGVKPKYYNFNVEDLEKLRKIFKKEKFDGIIHFAGYKAVSESTQKPLIYYENNLTTTFALLHCMEEFGVNNFVFSSSSTVYGVPTRVPLVETDEVKSSLSPYGETKVMIERILEDVAKVNPQFNIAILRYFNPIGADPSGLLGEDPNGIPNNLLPIINNVVLGKQDVLKITGTDYPTKDGSGVRDYIHVCDLAEGHMLALNKLKQNCGLVYYNLGTGKGSSVYDIVHAYEKANNVKIPTVVAPRRPGDIAENFANCDKAEKELGFKCKYTIEDACKHAYQFIMSNKE